MTATTHTVTRTAHLTGATKATCTCGWTEVSHNARGLNLSIRAHVKAATA